MTGDNRLDDDDDLVIDGRFRLGRFLGSGATSAVFEALDLIDGDLVALKLQHQHLSTTEESRRLFLREVEHSPTAQHPNLVAVRASGVHDGSDVLQAWIAVDHAPGITLAEWVELNGPLFIADAITVASSVLNGLSAVHGLGLVHRDISPNNLLVATTPGDAVRPTDVRLIDFGLATRADDPDVPTFAPDGLVAGSVNFVSPEQARGLRVDERGDLYSVACVLFFCLTAQAPFTRASSELTLSAHVNSPPPLPSALRPEVSRDLDRLVARGLSKRPDDRFATAKAMLDAIPRPAVTLVPRDGADDRPDARTSVMPPAAVRTAVPPAIDAATERFAVTGVRTRATSRPLTARSAASTGSTKRAARPPRRRANGLVVTVIAAASVAVAWGLIAAVAQTTPAPTPSAAAAPPPTAEPVEAAAAPPQELRGTSMPDVSSLAVDQATARLAAAGLVVSGVIAVDSTATQGTVLSTSPSAGVWIPLGDGVTLSVASGSNMVPPVAGLSREAAIGALQAAGFAVATATVEDPVAVTGSVLGSQPGDGTAMPLGSTITVLVAFTTPHSAAPTATPALPTTAPVPAVTPSATPEPPASP